MSMNFFPLCTKNVIPTKSGVIVDRLDHVFIGVRAPDAMAALTLSDKLTSTKNPFFLDRVIGTSSPYLKIFLLF
jgi:hypothetical protein